MEQLQPVLDWAKKHVKWLIGVGVLLILVIVLFSTFNGIRNTGVDKETALSAQYLDNQNELSTYISKFYEQIGIADRKSEQLNRILEDAVKGRYDNDLQAATPGESGGALISAIVEAYPDLSGLDSYDKVLDTISAGREAYKQKQTKLLDMLRNYDKWREQGLIHNVLVNIAGYPSDNLKARLGSKVVTGQAALDQMYMIVLTSQAAEAYETGELDPLEAPSLPE